MENTYGIGILRFNQTNWSLEFKLENGTHMIVPTKGVEADEETTYAVLIRCESDSDVVAEPEIVTYLSL